jgi:hypothetical protein
MNKSYFFLLICCFTSQLFTMQLRVRPTHHKPTVTRPKMATRTACTCTEKLRDKGIEAWSDDKTADRTAIKQRIDLHKKIGYTSFDEKREEPRQILEQAYNACCPQFEKCVKKNRYKRIASYAGTAIFAGACIAMPTAACENFIATGIVGALASVPLNTAEENRIYLAMIAKKEIKDLHTTFTRYTRLLKAHDTMEHEEKKEQL